MTFLAHLHATATRRPSSATAVRNPTAALRAEDAELNAKRQAAQRKLYTTRVWL